MLSSTDEVYQLMGMAPDFDFSYSGYKDRTSTNPTEPTYMMLTPEQKVALGNTSNAQASGGFFSDFMNALGLGGSPGEVSANLAKQIAAYAASHGGQKPPSNWTPAPMPLPQQGSSFETMLRKVPPMVWIAGAVGLGFVLMKRKGKR